jgi:hypothetical protein
MRGETGQDELVTTQTNKTIRALGRKIAERKREI